MRNTRSSSFERTMCGSGQRQGCPLWTEPWQIDRRGSVRSREQGVKLGDPAGASSSYHISLVHPIALAMPAHATTVSAGLQLSSITACACRQPSSISASTQGGHSRRRRPTTCVRAPARTKCFIIRRSAIYTQHFEALELADTLRPAAVCPMSFDGGLFHRRRCCWRPSLSRSCPRSLIPRSGT